MPIMLHVRLFSSSHWRADGRQGLGSERLRPSAINPHPITIIHQTHVSNNPEIRFES
jgi:hypothetical protein